MEKLNYKILILLMLFPAGLFTQSELSPEIADTLSYTEAYPEIEYTPYVPPPLEPVEIRPVKKEQWAEAVRALDYSKDEPAKPKETKSRERQMPDFDPLAWTSATQGLGIFLQMLAVLAAVAAIAYGIYRMLKAPRNRLIARDGAEITLENLDDYLHETDLDRFLREALEKADFPVAIRLYYLQIIKSLSEKNAIKWSREKTNRDYLRETREYRLGEQFRAVTRAYERVWYGNQPLSAGEFYRLEPQFKGLLAAI